MGMSARDIMIGIMTAITESGLINVKYGDRDSLGLFQQRPSQGWGTPQQVTDPEYAARQFFKSLKGIKGRDNMVPWLAAQAVQRSAYESGSNYKPYWDDAQGIFNQGLKKIAGGGFGVAPKGPTTDIGRRAIRWATQRIGDAGWQGLCQMFVRMALGSSGGFPSAISAWYGAKHKHRNTRPSDIPAGVPVYWSGGSFGHVALSTGGGKLISTDYPNMGRIGTGTIMGLTKDWHKHLLGWTEDINGKRIWGLPGLADGGSIRWDNTVANLHKDETVLTAPLSDSLERGIHNLESGGGNVYNQIDVHPAPGMDENALAELVVKKIDRRNTRAGVSRNVGSRR